MTKKIIKKTRKSTSKKMGKSVQPGTEELNCCGEKKCDLGKVEVFVCPSCQSVNVSYYFGIRNLFGIVPRMRCNDCSFTSVIFPKWIVDKTKIPTKRNLNPKLSDIHETKKIKNVDHNSKIREEYCPNCTDEILVKMNDGKVNKFVCENCKFNVKKKVNKK